MPNLLSVSYMIGQFQDGISERKPKRETNPIGSFNIDLCIVLYSVLLREGFYVKPPEIQTV